MPLSSWGSDEMLHNARYLASIVRKAALERSIASRIAAEKPS